MGNNYYQYYVEGDDDRKIVNTLKTEFQTIQPGKVDVFNVVQNLLNKNRIQVLKKDTTVVLVFDTDTSSSEILKKNIEFLEKQKIIKDVICVPQVRNLEEELVRACDIKHVKELTGSKTDSEFKSDVLKMNNLKQKLEEKEFRLDEFWCSLPKGDFTQIRNESEKIRK